MENDKREENIEVSLVFDVNSAIEHIQKSGFLQLNERDHNEEDGINMVELEKRLKEEGFVKEYDFIYDPKQVEVKTVDTEKGLDPKYRGEGWEEVTRISGSRTVHPTLIRKKNR